MAASSSTSEIVYQFKVILKRFKPSVWRRIQVPANYTFLDLHVAIQGAMGWSDYHLHEFTMINPRTKKNTLITDEESLAVGLEMFDDAPKRIDEKNTEISQFFLAPKDKCRYDYDLGFSWEHDIVFEKTLPAVTGRKYPQCTAGRQITPPEDGVWGGEEERELIQETPAYELYDMYMLWLEENGKPTKFNPKSVKFRGEEEPSTP